MGATSNLSRILAIAETIPGTTPTSGKADVVRFTSESLAFNVTTDTSKEIRDDRMISDLVQTGADASGAINFELSYGSFDKFIEAALAGTWASNKVSNGKVKRSWSLEVGFTDIAQFLLYRGMQVNTMALEFTTGQITSGNFGFMGFDVVSASSSGMPSPSAPNPATDTEIIDSATGFASLSVAGTTVNCGASRVTLNTDNGLRARAGLGKLGACEILLGTFSATGELDLYFENGSIYKKYLENEAFAVTWEVKDKAGNKYTFTLPRVKITNAVVNSGGLDTDVSLTVSYQALRDPTTAVMVTVERTPVTPPAPGP